MSRSHAVAVGVVLFASQSCRPADAGEWADRISEVRNEAHAGVQEAVAAQDHARAKERVRARDVRLKAILAAFEEAGEQALPETDVIAVIQAYELLWRWERGAQVASDYVATHPESEAAYMALFRCLLNLGRVEEAAGLLEDIQGAFPPNSPIQFVHSMLAAKYQDRKEWDLALDHAETSARLRIAMLRTHPGVARSALPDFRRIVDTAVAMGDEGQGIERLGILMSILDQLMAELASESRSDSELPTDSEPPSDSELPSDSLFVQQCVVRQLRSDIAYWLGAGDVAVPFREWIEFIVDAWKTESVPKRAAGIQAMLAVRYLDRQGGVLTPAMLDTLDDLREFVDSCRSSGVDDAGLTELSRRCQRLIEAEVFRPRDEREAFGGIGPQTTREALRPRREREPIGGKGPQTRR